VAGAALQQQHRRQKPERKQGGKYADRLEMFVRNMHDYDLGEALGCVYNF